MINYSKSIFYLFLLFVSTAYAQDSEEFEEDQDSSRFAFGVNVGAHFANKNTAGLYTGSPNVSRFGIDYIINQPFNRQTFDDFFEYPYEVAEYPFDPRYQTAAEMGFFMAYQLGKRRAHSIFMDFNISQLRIEQNFTIAVDDPLNRLPGPTFQRFPIFGRENRFLLNLGTQISYFQGESSNAYIALFANATNVQMRRNYIVINNREYEIFHVNAERPNDRLGGVGFGGGSGLGFQFYLNDFILCDLYYNLYYTQINFNESWQPYGTHHSLGLRIIWSKKPEEELEY